MITKYFHSPWLFILSLTAALLCSCQDQTSTLEKYQHALNSHHSISYHTHIKIWSSIKTDTINEDDEIALEKLPGDTLLNGRVWISNQYGEKYYNGTTVYYHNKDSAATDEYLLSEGGIYNILGNISARAILFDFLDTAGAAYKRCDSNVSTINGATEIDTFFVKNEDGSASVVVYTFLNGAAMPAKISWTKKINDVIARRELTLTHVSFDQDIAKIWASHGAGKLPVVVRHPAPAPQPLSVGAQTIPIDGTNAETGVKERTINDKLVVLDFWFIGCKPCMDAMPHLIALRKKYPASKVAIYGINASDTNRDGVQAFMKKEGVNYPVLLCAPDILNRYAVHAFPTFYVLDKSGKVILSEMGYDDAGFDERVSKIIDKHL